jgi:hypothetical protein
MLIQMSGSRDGEPWPDKGEEGDLPTAAAAHLVAAGVAERVDTEPGEPRKQRTGGRRGHVRST